MMDGSDIWRLVAVLALVGANAFFVAAEFALVRTRRLRIRELMERGDRLAGAADRAQEELDRSISGTQLGITLASLALGWVGVPGIAAVLDNLLSGLAVALPPAALYGIAIALAFAFIAYLHIVLGELAPKSAALLHPETTSRLVAPALNAFTGLMSPFIWFLNGSSNLLLRSFGLGAVGAMERVHSPEEIQMLVEQGMREGVVEEDEQAMIHGVFELTHTVARELMTPRTDIVGVEADAGLEEVLDVAARSGFSRLPVYQGSIDNVIGVLLVKDLLPWLVRKERSDVRARKLVREALFIPDTKPVDDLLAELRQQKVHMAIVVDEFGGTDGIVTLEDLVEEIVGEIYDEHDVEHFDVTAEPDGGVLVDGGYSYADLAERFELEWNEQDEDYDTVAGFVIGRLGRIPAEGDRVVLGEGGAELEVVGVEDRRVTRLRLHLPTAPAGRDGSDASGRARTEEP